MRVSGSKTLFIAASVASCRACLLDVGAYPTWYPGVRQAAVLESGDGGVLARLVFHTGLPVLAEIECVLRLEALGPGRVRPGAAEGALQIDGPGWTLMSAADETTEATYEIGVEMSVPGGFVTERLVKGKARHFLIDAPVAALKLRVEG